MTPPLYSPDTRTASALAQTSLGTALAGSRNPPCGTHPIAAALFADLVAADSFDALHRLAAAVARGRSDEIAAASRDVARIGSSSGFDMLAGFCIGVCGEEAFAP